MFFPFLGDVSAVGLGRPPIEPRVQPSGDGGADVAREDLGERTPEYVAEPKFRPVSHDASMDVPVGEDDQSVEAIATEVIDRRCAKVCCATDGRLGFDPDLLDP